MTSKSARLTPPMRRLPLRQGLDLGIGTALVLILTLLGESGCKGKSDDESRPLPPPISTQRAATSRVQATPTPKGKTPATRKTPLKEEQAPPTPPESFKGGEPVDMAQAVGLGCSARSASGWLELLCRKRNGTGGRPLRAIRDLESFESTDGGSLPAADSGVLLPDASDDPADAALPNVEEVDAHGELRIAVPWRDGESAKVRVQWSNTEYDLVVDGKSAKLVLPNKLALRRQCAKLGKASAAVIAEAKKLEGEAALTASDVAKLPNWGVCQVAGLGAWSLTLEKLAASGMGESRVLRADLTVTHVDPDGQVTSAKYGSLEFAPKGLQMKPLMVYDYDDDGQDEVIIRYEVASLPQGRTPPTLFGIFSLKGGRVAPYAGLGALGQGSVSVEQLDFDMRPDLADHGPFIAYLSGQCGPKPCPPRIAGPRFFAHALPKGTFSRSDDAALGALKRACPNAPDSVVVLQGKEANVERTAHQLVCAKVWGAGEQTLVEQLDAKRDLLCGSDPECPLLTTLKAWARQALPARLAAAKPEAPPAEPPSEKPE